MAFRGDITVDWSQSPRQIVVASPSAELNIQDLIDTLRTIEATTAAMDEPHLLDASGGESLEGGASVGLTVQLQNAVVGFQDRAGPTWEQCKILGGNLTAVDGLGASIYPILGTAFVNVGFVQDTSASTVAVGTVPALDPADSLALQKIIEVWQRLDLDPSNPVTYAQDLSTISSSIFELNKTVNGNGTSTIHRS